MKKVLIKTGTILIYIVALLWLVEFRIWILLDVKLILMVVFGTVLLTLSSYKKDSKLIEWKAPARWNAQITGYLTTFVLLFSRLSGNQDYNNLMYDIALCCRPLLYGLILNILLNSNEVEQSREEKTANPVSDLTINLETVQQKLLGMGLTDREIEITVCIMEGLSNKEIGARLFISESTVKKHTGNLYKKLGISNREQLKQRMM